MRTNFRANEVLALFDKLGDAFKTEGRTETGTQGETKSPLEGALRMGIEHELDAQRAKLQAQSPQAREAQPQQKQAPRDDPQRPQAPQQAARDGGPHAQQPPAQAKEGARAPETRGAPPEGRPQLDHPVGEGARATMGRALGELGDGFVRGAFGFEAADRAHGGNHAETANVARFLRDPGVHADPREARSWKGENVRSSDCGAFVEIRERRDRKADDKRRDERADDVKALAQADAKRGEVKEGREREVDVHGTAGAEQAALEELRDKHGAGWQLEKPLEEEVKPDDQLRINDSLGETHRCHGTLEDGSRCLRRPIIGVPYCREHAVALGHVSAEALDGVTGEVPAYVPEEPILEGPATDPSVPAFVVTD